MYVDDRPDTALRRARRRQGLSLERAAVAAGVSSGWLRLVERDPTLLSRRVAERLLPVLGLRPEDYHPGPGHRP